MRRGQGGDRKAPLKLIQNFPQRNELVVWSKRVKAIIPEGFAVAPGPFAHSFLRLWVMQHKRYGS